MQRQHRALLGALVAAFLAVPPAAATWFAMGTYEPDTIHDQTGGFVWEEADTSPDGKRIYFNAYPTEYPTGVNPNNGILGSRVLVAGVRQYFVLLGSWVDCNRDDHVGSLETALTSYRSEILLDMSACPPSAASMHNDGEWVHEWIPIGYAHGEVNQNLHPIQIQDRDARVWADFGLPGAAGAQTCPIVPLPHGTTAGSGWAIRYLDCFVGKRVTTTVNEADPDDALGLRFDDPNNPQYSDSRLNQHLPESLFGNPATGETGTLQLDSDEDDANYDRDDPAATSPEYAFTTWDCEGRALEVRDPTGLAPRTIVVDDDGAVSGDYGQVDENLTDADGNYAWLARPAPTVHDPRDSVADGVNETFRGFRVGGGDENRDTTVGGDCDEAGDDQDGDNTYSGLHQTAFFYPDGNHEGGTQVVGKKQQDVRFNYFNGGENDAAVGDAVGNNADGLFGLNGPDAGWVANIIYVTAPQSVNRNTLEVQGGLYLTFYGSVGAGTFAAGYTSRGTTAAYGSEACGTLTSGIVNGWDCDATHWYTDSNGNDIAQIWDVRVHAPYQFRDIDCDDGTLARGTGLHASLADLSATGPCLDAA